MQDLIEWNQREAKAADDKADDLLRRARDKRCSKHTHMEYMRQAGEQRGNAIRFRQNAAALQLTVPKVDKLIDELDTVGMDYDKSRFGLPCHVDEQMKIMRLTVCRVMQGE